MGTRPAGRLTSRDVAAELGVSAKTVSNAYVRPDQLSDVLRQRILAVAARLGYPGPDPVAAGLRRGRVGAIGFAYDNRLSYAFDDPTTSALLTGVTAVADDAGAGLLLLPGSSEPQRRIAAATQAVVDGVIASSVADDDPLLQLVIARRLPLVVIDQPRPDRLAELGAAGAPWVGIDDQAAAETAAGHLFGLGHRHVGVISFGLSRGSRRPGSSTSTARQPPPSRSPVAGSPDTATPPHGTASTGTVFRSGEGPTARRIRARPAPAPSWRCTPRPTALLCLSDRLAEGAAACRRPSRAARPRRPVARRLRRRHSARGRPKPDHRPATKPPQRRTRRPGPPRPPRRSPSDPTQAAARPPRRSRLHQTSDVYNSRRKGRRP